MSAATEAAAPAVTPDPEAEAPTEAPATTEPGAGVPQPAAEAPSSPSSPSSQSARAAALREGRALRTVRMVGMAASLTAALLLGWAVYAFGFSKLQEQHSQADLYRALAGELGQATAPVGPAADGAPVAIMDIPAIGLHQTVVVEGTTGSDLARGPGHLRYTVLPGQPGVSTLLGRRGTFGAPFAELPRLRLGDKITFTTGQGAFTYTVNAFGQGSKPVMDSFPNRLVLATGDSTWIPTHVIYVGARLDGAPTDASGQRGTKTDLDKPLSSDTDAWPALQLWALALALAVAATVVLAVVGNRRAVYLSTAPVLAALLWCVYENATVLLPNLY
ncbi:sortase A [Catenulispora sp. GP43]|uniref:class E sortase n=1 Tax=Catenulispora sp. GP43 TaxID=3156263 RepID=UPI003511A5B3